MNFPDDLKRGDTLLYFDDSLVDKIVAWKEGNPIDPVGHVEVYAGEGQSWASRNKGTDHGVNLYPFRIEGLAIVRRPVAPFDVNNVAEQWFKSIRGLPYGMADNLDDAGIEVTAGGMNCSHTAATLYHAVGNSMFDPTYPAKAITPDDFRKSLASVQIFP